MNADEMTSRVAAPSGAAAGTTIGGMRVDAGSYATATARIVAWVRAGMPRYVCVANVHMVMEAHDSPAFRQLVNAADLVTSDGMPLVWLLRRRGHPGAERVYGPDLMLHVCGAAAAAGLSIGLFGGSQGTLERLEQKLAGRFPELRIVTRIAPSFGEMSAAENEAHMAALTAGGASIIFVGLGCPRQERWMAANSARLPAVLIGVGAAFRFHAGEVRQAPGWLQRVGLEWAFRFAMEPRRLWRRYLVQSPRFVALLVRESLRRRSTHP